MGHSGHAGIDVTDYRLNSGRIRINLLIHCQFSSLVKRFIYCLYFDFQKLITTSLRNYILLFRKMKYEWYYILPFYFDVFCLYLLQEKIERNNSDLFRPSLELKLNHFNNKSVKRITQLCNYRTIILIFISTILINGCKKKSDSPGSPGTNEVWMQSNAFNPSSKTITHGTTITWTNKDSHNHTVTSNTSGVYDSGQLGQDQTFTFKFDSTGNFAYHCNNHSGMTGNITVQ